MTRVTDGGTAGDQETRDSIIAGTATIVGAATIAGAETIVGVTIVGPIVDIQMTEAAFHRIARFVTKGTGTRAVTSQISRPKNGTIHTQDTSNAMLEVSWVWFRLP